MENWNNVELTSLRKKSYTLNHEYDAVNKCIVPIDNSENKPASEQNDTKDNGAAKATELLQPGMKIKPNVGAEDVESLVRRLYGITTNNIKLLNAYDDINYLIQPDWNIKNPIITTPWSHGYVLKIHNEMDSKQWDFIEAQNELKLYLAKKDIVCPRPVANVNGKFCSVEIFNGIMHVVRLLEYIPGKLFHEVEKSNYLLYTSGEYLAKVDRAMKNFANEAYERRKSNWMLGAVPELRGFLYALKDLERKELVEEIITSFENNVLVHLDKLETQIIHGDYNEQNIIVDKSKSSPNGEYTVKGIIDFGDTSKSPLIFELGIALTYIMLQTNSLESGGYFLAGYTTIQPISKKERALLKYCVAARLAQSLVMGIYTNMQDPSNEYVLVTQKGGWEMIEDLWRNNFTKIDELWQETADKYLTQSIK